jgi:AraC-like DNA-binding protein
MRYITEPLNLILLNVGYAELNANWNWKGIYSPFARFYYVKDGSAKTRIGNKVYLLEPNHLYLTPPFTLHDDECDSRFSLYYIHFYEEVANKESIFDKYAFPVGIKASELDYSLTQRLLAINPERHLRYLDPEMYDNFPTFSEYLAHNNRMPVHSIIETQGILHQLAAKFMEQASAKADKKDSRINKCLQYIHENLDKNISVSDMANLSCLSEDHLIRLFKKNMNCTPLKYINLKKTEKAQLLLLTSNMPVRDIAMELLIENISYFNKLFKQHTGKTPGQYRKEYQTPRLISL